MCVERGENGGGSGKVFVLRIHARRYYSGDTGGASGGEANRGILESDGILCCNVKEV